MGAFFGNSCRSQTEHGRSVCGDQEPFRAFNFSLDQQLDEVGSWIQLGGIQRDPVGALMQGQWLCIGHTTKRIDDVHRGDLGRWTHELKGGRL